MPDKDLYAFRQSEGLCVECGTQPAVEERTRCAACRETNAHWHALQFPAPPVPLLPAAHQRKARLAQMRQAVQKYHRWWEHGLPKEADAWDETDPWGEALPGNRLLCCGRWIAITAVPFTAPCCGRRWLIETAVVG